MLFPLIPDSKQFLPSDSHERAKVCAPSSPPEDVDVKPAVLVTNHICQAANLCP
jgi:hypothetical protein